MKTYNAFVLSNSMSVSVMNLQEMFDKAYEIAEIEGDCKIYDYDDDENEGYLIWSFKNSNGKIITTWDNSRINL